MNPVTRSVGDFQAAFSEIDFSDARLKDLVQRSFALIVSVEKQKMSLIDLRDYRIVKDYPISTATAGVGEEEGSGRTPRGLHFIDEMIGDGCSPRTWFVSRQPQDGEMEAGKSYITARILWLRGLQPGLNSGVHSQTGKSVDTHDRYIYIHGTNEEDKIGTPVSSGCVRMRPDDIIELYNRVMRGTLVLIH